MVEVPHNHNPAIPSPFNKSINKTSEKTENPSSEVKVEVENQRKSPEFSSAQKDITGRAFSIPQANIKSLKDFAKLSIQKVIEGEIPIADFLGINSKKHTLIFDDSSKTNQLKNLSHNEKNKYIKNEALKIIKAYSSGDYNHLQKSDKKVASIFAETGTQSTSLADLKAIANLAISFKGKEYLNLFDFTEPKLLDLQTLKELQKESQSKYLTDISLNPKSDRYKNASKLLSCDLTMHKMNLNNPNLSRMGFPAESFTKRQITLMHMASAFCNENELLSESLENIKKTPESLNTFIKAFEYYDIPDEIREKVDTKINKIYRSNIQSIEQLKKDITTEVEEVLNVYSDSIENLLNQINSNLNKTFTNSARNHVTEPGSENSNKLNFKEYKDTVFQDLCSDLQMLATEPKEKDKFYYLIDEINISLNQAYETGFNKNLSMTANVENFQKKLRDGLNEVFKDYQSKINDLKDRTNDNLQKVFQNTDFSYRNESTIKRVKETINPPLETLLVVL